MKTLKINQNSDEWFEARKGKITGSKLKDIIVKRGNGKKIGFYQLIADRVAVEPDDEDQMERGHRLQSEAIEAFEKKHNCKTEQIGMWIADFNDNIAISPDAVVSDKEAVEVKCLKSANHLKAVIENEIPSEHFEQVVQYFIVNEQLETLYFVLYDPRIVARPYHEIKVVRDDIAPVVEQVKDYQIQTLKEVDEWVERLAF